MPPIKTKAFIIPLQNPIDKFLARKAFGMPQSHYGVFIIMGPIGRVKVRLWEPGQPWQLSGIRICQEGTKDEES